MTFIHDPPTRTAPEEPQLLFAEARARRRRRRTFGGILVVVLVALIALAGATVLRSGADSPPTPPRGPTALTGAQGTGTVTGTLMLESVTEHGLPGAVRFKGANDSSHTVGTASNGTFRVRLRPGTYHVLGGSPAYRVNGSIAPCTTIDPIVVSAGRTTNVTVVCEGM